MTETTPQGEPREATADSALPRDERHVTRILRDGELRVVGRIRDASNATLLAEAEQDGERLDCVYKPIAGERPLWDFPDGTLAGREVAAYTVSRATGWRLVPPTVMREDGPFGPGMCQQWIDTSPQSELLAVLATDAEDSDGWLPIIEVELSDGTPGVLAHRDDARLARIATLDVVINNADRKGGHLLPTEAGHVYGVDHGVTFHVEDKLRTLLWGFAGRQLTTEAREVLDDLRTGLVGGELREELGQLISAPEIEAAARRVHDLLSADRYPGPGGRRRAIPWPPI